MADSKPAAVEAMEHVDNPSDAEKASKGKSMTHVAGDALLIDGQGAIRCLPIPSNDPNDPLNFKTWEKIATIFCCCWFCKWIPG
jgi:hypothetical protein